MRNSQQRPRNSIRWKLLSTMIGLIVVLVVTMTSIEVILQKKSLENELSKRINLMKVNLIERGNAMSNLMLTQVENDVAAFNFSRITENLHNTIKESPLLDYGILMNNEGIVFIHTSHPELQQEVVMDDQSQYALAQQQLTHQEYPDNNVTEFILPIHFGTKQWGVLRLGFSLKELQQEISNSREEITHTTQNMITTTTVISLFFVFIGSIIVLVISTTLSRPLIRLTESVKELARGNFESATQLLDNHSGNTKTDFKAEGEIGELANSFLEMANEIQQSHQNLEEYNRTLEQKVKERTQELEEVNEKLKELDQMKTNFLSTVSHELRTPLTSVIGFARIMQKKFESVLFPALAENEDKKVMKAIRQVMDNTAIIVEEGERLTSLINNVLDLAKMEAGRVDWNITEMNIETVINRSIASTSSLFDVKPVKLVKEIPSNLPLCLGDYDRLIQVVINLISNAIKFTNEGKVTIKVEYLNAEIITSVIDSGTGIKKEDQPLVFEKFKQVGDTLTDKPQGTGLGLPICKEIVEHLGGRIWVESEIGLGSTFSFSLPESIQQNESSNTYDDIDYTSKGLLVSKDGEEVSYIWQTNGNNLEDALSNRFALFNKPKHKKNPCILIIDDNLNIRQFLHQVLSTASYDVHEASSGTEGLEIIKNILPDLIILDVIMPQLNGFKVTVRLHTNPLTLHIPIILHTIAEDHTLGEQLGIDCYLNKPVKDEVLLDAVKQLLETQKTRKKILLFIADNDKRQRWVSLLTQYELETLATQNIEDGISAATAFDPQLVIADTALVQQYNIIEKIRDEHRLDKIVFTLLDETNSV